jgi:hypothetical protein
MPSQRPTLTAMLYMVSQFLIPDEKEMFGKCSPPMTTKMAILLDCVPWRRHERSANLHFLIAHNGPAPGCGYGQHVGGAKEKDSSIKGLGHILDLRSLTSLATPESLWTKVRARQEGSPEETWLRTVLDLVTELYAVLVIGTVHSTVELEVLCNEYPMDKLEAINVNTTLFQDILCKNAAGGLPTPAEIHSGIVTMASEYFLIQYLLATRGNLTTACDIFNAEIAALGGIDSAYVKEMVCSVAAAAGNGTEAIFANATAVLQSNLASGAAPGTPSGTATWASYPATYGKTYGKLSGTAAVAATASWTTYPSGTAAGVPLGAASGTTYGTPSGKPFGMPVVTPLGATSGTSVSIPSGTSPGTASGPPTPVASVTYSSFEPDAPIDPNVEKAAMSLLLSAV